MTFISRQLVRFAHVDAAGIVFYPRYFEMLNAAVEDLFAEVVGVDFATMHLRRRIGVPTVKLEAEFARPSRLGDQLDFRIAIAQVGQSSAELAIEVHCGDEVRFTARPVLVCMNLDSGRPEAWPADIRPPAPAAAA